MNAHYTERNEAWIKKAQEIEEVKKLKEKYESLYEKMVEEFKFLSEYEPSCGGEYIFSSYVKRGNVDYSLIPELKYVDLEEYRKPSITTWRLHKVKPVESE